MSEDRNDIAYWFPRLAAAGVPVPRTLIFHPSSICNLDLLLAGEKPDGFDHFLGRLKWCAREFAGPPWFLRTGHTAGKHGWERTCCVQDLDRIGHHVAALVEYSALADILGLPTTTWAVREFLPLQVAFHAFPDRMPIAREFRCFRIGGKLACVHPYWPADSLYAVDRPNWGQLLDAISAIDSEVENRCRTIVDRIGDALPGDWSIDVCPTTDDRWFVTDVAEADRSFHWIGCPNAPPAEIRKITP